MLHSGVEFANGELHVECSQGEVHLWWIDLDREAQSCALLRDVLSPEERERAARFRTTELRTRWTVAHAALRVILARYVGISPEKLIFMHGPHGRPELLGHAAGHLSFNLADTGGVAVVAVTSGARVGVDAEIMRLEIEVQDLAQRFFTREESEEILALPEDKRVPAFYRCWTRKEALIKAIGGGLSVRLDGFRVTMREDEPARLCWSDGDFTGDWSLLDVSNHEVAAAVAIDWAQPLLKLNEFTFPAWHSASPS
ncbi:MAG TPA: 4'-phosphopantetheinyl transferase superfamily protein [Terriglobales bacterium]